MLCICEDKNKDEHRLKFWRIVEYKCHHMAANNYARVTSNYSAIRCMNCGANWRSKGAYVDMLFVHNKSL